MGNRPPTPIIPSRLSASLPAASLPSTSDSDDGVLISIPAPASNCGETKSGAADSDDDKPPSELGAAGGSGGPAPAPARDDSDSDSDDVPLSVVTTGLKTKAVPAKKKDSVLKTKAAPHGLHSGDWVRALHDSNHIASRRAGDVGRVLAGGSLTESTLAVDWRAHDYVSYFDTRDRSVDPNVLLLQITKPDHAADADHHSKATVSVAVDKRSLATVRPHLLPPPPSREHERAAASRGRSGRPGKVSPSPIPPRARAQTLN